MILVKPEDTFTVELKYIEKDGKVEVTPNGDKIDTFIFRKPSWRDTRLIMAGASVGGDIDKIDPIKLMHMKIAVLLKTWSLKTEDGKELPLAQMDNLPASVVFALHQEVDKAIGGVEGLLGITAESSVGTEAPSA